MYIYIRTTTTCDAHSQIKRAKGGSLKAVSCIFCYWLPCDVVIDDLVYYVYIWFELVSGAAATSAFVRRSDFLGIW